MYKVYKNVDLLNQKKIVLYESNSTPNPNPNPNPTLNHFPNPRHNNNSSKPKDIIFYFHYWNTHAQKEAQVILSVYLEKSLAEEA